MVGNCGLRARMGEDKQSAGVGLMPRVHNLMIVRRWNRFLQSKRDC